MAKFQAPYFQATTQVGSIDVDKFLNQGIGYRRSKFDFFELAAVYRASGIDAIFAFANCWTEKDRKRAHAAGIITKATGTNVDDRLVQHLSRLAARNPIEVILATGDGDLISRVDAVARGSGGCLLRILGLRGKTAAFASQVCDVEFIGPHILKRIVAENPDRYFAT